MLHATICLIAMPAATAASPSPSINRRHSRAASLLDAENEFERVQKPHAVCHKALLLMLPCAVCREVSKYVVGVSTNLLPSRQTMVRGVIRGACGVACDAPEALSAVLSISAASPCPPRCTAAELTEEEIGDGGSIPRCKQRGKASSSKLVRGRHRRAVGRQH